MTKKILTTLALGLAVTLPSAYAATVALAPGGFTAAVPANGTNPPGPPGLSGGTIVATTTQSYTNGSNTAISVMVTEDVVKETGGTYDFYYQFTNTSSNTDSLNAVSMTNYTGFTTAVAYLSDGTAIVPANASPPMPATPSLLAIRTRWGRRLFWQATRRPGWRLTPMLLHTIRTASRARLTAAALTMTASMNRLFPSP